MDSVLLIILIVWGFPSTFFRNKFRKIVYETNDWKINIKPFFIKELKGLLFNIYPNNNEYLKTRNQYRTYLIIYLLLFVTYLNMK
tara:strand:+ start:9855 stop:10109 length:255 start_codon:yes stop_codon:yes gene_type:complete